MSLFVPTDIRIRDIIVKRIKKLAKDKKNWVHEYSRRASQHWIYSAHARENSTDIEFVYGCKSDMFMVNFEDYINNSAFNFNMINELFPYGVDSFIENAFVDDIEIDFVIKNIDFSDLIAVYSNCILPLESNSFDGDFMCHDESYPERLFVHIRDDTSSSHDNSRKISIGSNNSVTSQKSIRLSFSLFKVFCKLKRSSNHPDHLKKLKIVTISDLMRAPSHDQNWIAFLKMCRLVGVTGALSQYDSNVRDKLRKQLISYVEVLGFNLTFPWKAISDAIVSTHNN
jgi:hypothetical protein